MTLAPCSLPLTQGATSSACSALFPPLPSASLPALPLLPPLGLPSAMAPTPSAPSYTRAAFFGALFWLVVLLCCVQIGIVSVHISAPHLHAQHHDAPHKRVVRGDEPHILARDAARRRQSQAQSQAGAEAGAEARAEAGAHAPAQAVRNKHEEPAINDAPAAPPPPQKAPPPPQKAPPPPQEAPPPPQKAPPPRAPAAPPANAAFKVDPRFKTPPAPGAPAHQPYAPYGVYFVAGDVSDIQRKRPACPGVDKAAWDATGCCGHAYFIGGGKAGSTTMATLLKHHPDNNYALYDPNGPFADAGKEVCWALHGQTAPSHYFSHFRDCLKCPPPNGKAPLVALDACPRYTDMAVAARIACVHPDTRFIMLAREPVRRLISHYNDQRIRGGLREQPESYMSRVMKTPDRLEYVLSNYASILANFLAYFAPEQILVVQSEALGRSDEEVQRLVDIVCDHLGVAHRTVVMHHGNANSIVDKHRYLMPNNDTMAQLHASFQPHVDRLARMLGARPDWKGY